jgi:hypothetical protein
MMLDREAQCSFVLMRAHACALERDSTALVLSRQRGSLAWENHTPSNCSAVRFPNQRHFWMTAAAAAANAVRVAALMPSAQSVRSRSGSERLEAVAPACRLLFDRTSPYYSSIFTAYRQLISCRAATARAHAANYFRRRVQL